MGYDGKGQVRVNSRDDVRAAFDAIDGVPCLLEKMLPLAYEVSVLTARGDDGESVVYPIAENVHRDGILFTTTVPGPNVSADCARSRRRTPRARSSPGSATSACCASSSSCWTTARWWSTRWRRGRTTAATTRWTPASPASSPSRCARWRACRWATCRQHSPAVMLNILGDVWFDGDSDRARAGLGPGARTARRLPAFVRQGRARRGRKMGHVTFVAPTLAQAQEQLRAACAILDIAP